MKRHFIFLLLSLGLLLSGCGRDQYAIEKQYYSALKQAEKIFKNPHATPPNELQRIVNTLSAFSKKYPKSNLAIDAEFNIARLYIVKEEYEKARLQLKKISNDYSAAKGICAEATFLTGNSYEIENKWESALSQYKKIIRDYPETPRGLDMPIYIIQHYKIKFQPDMMMDAARDAITHYNSLADKYPSSLLAFQSYSLTAECYLILKEWQNSINTYEKIMEKYKGKIAMDGILMKIATIYKRELNNDIKARETLERLLKEYPKSSFVNAAKSFLKK